MPMASVELEVGGLTRTDRRRDIADGSHPYMVCAIIFSESCAENKRYVFEISCKRRYVFAGVREAGTGRRHGNKRVSPSMPRQGLGSIQNDLLEQAALSYVIANVLDDLSLAPDDDHDEVEEDEETRALAQLLSDGRQQAADALRLYGQAFMTEAASLLGDGRRGPYFRVLTTDDWFVRALSQPDRQFRFIFRVSRPTFDKFCEILGRNTLFVSRGRKPQRHISWQLGTFLIRYGQLGSSVQDTALKLGIGYGTVILYCKRVIRAIRNDRDMPEEEVDEFEAADVPQHETATWLKREGLRKRKEALDLAYPAHLYV
ncbi:hypothetical protein GGX14DRAFT_387979 [Mycena pura]|uniref:Uncharacterized protein n=1 Tax=Mycena pura TaxID=153505 RepID=A0AAD6VT90_9AGAR|nr:hypothetical protein GGX14DRAFT_387979 [Mycena pura]